MQTSNKSKMPLLKPTTSMPVGLWKSTAVTLAPRWLKKCFAPSLHLPPEYKRLKVNAGQQLTAAQVVLDS